MFESVMGIIQKVVIAGGTILVAYNGIVALMAWRNHQGQEVSNNLMGAAAGAGIILLGALLGSITL